MAEPLQGLTVEAARRRIAARLAESGTDSPELDARLLTGAALDLDLTGLMRDARRSLTSDEAARIEQMIARRERGEPVARILGSKEFWGLKLQLNADTLVPRPDTETIIEALLEQLRMDQRLQEPLLIADLGTGSGAIILALLSELPNARGVATDISLNALTMAQDNARSCQLIERCLFVNTNYADALKPGIDIIVSNPPYIPSAHIAGLEIDVRAHDPMRALDGGDDGLDAYRAIVPAACAKLARNGLLAFEIGHDQSFDVTRIMSDSGLKIEGDARTDLGGNRRVVMARRAARDPV